MQRYMNMLDLGDGRSGEFALNSMITSASEFDFNVVYPIPEVGVFRGLLADGETGAISDYLGASHSLTGWELSHWGVYGNPVCVERTGLRSIRFETVGAPAVRMVLLFLDKFKIQDAVYEWTDDLPIATSMGRITVDDYVFQSQGFGPGSREALDIFCKAWPENLDAIREKSELVAVLDNL